MTKLHIAGLGLVIAAAFGAGVLAQQTPAPASQRHTNTTPAPCEAPHAETARTPYVAATAQP